MKPAGVEELSSDEEGGDEADEDAAIGRRWALQRTTIIERPQIKYVLLLVVVGLLLLVVVVECV